MKKSFIGYAFTLIMAFGIASCGKSGGGGGGGTGIETINTGGVSVSQNVATTLSNLNSWYVSTNEGSYGLSSGKITYDVYRTTSANSAGSQNCPGKEIKIFGVVVGCFQTSSTSWGQTPSGTPTTVTASSGVAKSSNAALASIVSKINSGLILDAVQYGPVYTIVVREAAGSNNVRVYTIDTNYHSAFQPMMEQSSQGVTVVNAIIPK